MAEEEIYLQSVFEQWLPKLPRPQRRSEFELNFGNANPSEGEEGNKESERLGDSGDQNHTTEERAEPADDRIHAEIASDLEHMQTRLDEVLKRWRESSPHHPEAGASAGPTGDSMATSEDTAGALSGGNAGRERTEADEMGTESTPPEHARSFWPSSSLAELAEAQGVGPAENLEEIAALWPSDDDPDELLDHVLAERAARRQAMGGDSNR